MTNIEKLRYCLDRENPDGYSDHSDGGIELQFSQAILVLHPDGRWTLEDFGVGALAAGVQR